MTTATKAKTRLVRAPLAPDYFTELWAARGKAVQANEAASSAAAQATREASGGQLEPLVDLHRPWWA